MNLFDVHVSVIGSRNNTTVLIANLLRGNKGTIPQLPGSEKKKKSRANNRHVHATTINYSTQKIHHAKALNNFNRSQHEKVIFHGAGLYKSLTKNNFIRDKALVNQETQTE